MDEVKDTLNIARDILPFVSPVIFATSALAAISAIFINRNMNKCIKSMDVVLKCDDRYDTLLTERNRLFKEWERICVIKDREKIVAASPEDMLKRKSDEEVLERDTQIFYIRFWGLMLDQIDYFELGFIERNIFLNWTLHKARLFYEDRHFGSLGFKDGWKK